MPHHVFKYMLEIFKQSIHGADGEHMRLVDTSPNETESAFAQHQNKVECGDRYNGPQHAGISFLESQLVPGCHCRSQRFVLQPHHDLRERRGFAPALPLEGAHDLFKGDILIGQGSKRRGPNPAYDHARAWVTAEIGAENYR